MASCRHTKYAGFVTNQNPDTKMDLDRAHMSQYVCARPECIEATKVKVQKFTGEPAEFYTFRSRAVSS